MQSGVKSNFSSHFYTFPFSFGSFFYLLIQQYKNDWLYLTLAFSKLSYKCRICFSLFKKAVGLMFILQSQRCSISYCIKPVKSFSFWQAHIPTMKIIRTHWNMLDVGYSCKLFRLNWNYLIIVSVMCNTTATSVQQD